MKLRVFFEKTEPRRKRTCLTRVFNASSFGEAERLALERVGDEFGVTDIRYVQRYCPLRTVTYYRNEDGTYSTQ
jgi:hypothetical protein